jgi:CheY-like chemotaxis protein
VRRNEVAVGTPFGLVVDDDAQVRDIFAEVLRRAGIRVVEATSGNEALRLAQSPDLAFVVTDIEMADGDGWELCRQLRASITTSRLPIVVVSGTSLGQDADAIASGCDAVLRKPCSPATLLATIRRLMEPPRDEAEPEREDREDSLSELP